MGFPVDLPNAIVLYRNDSQRTFTFRTLTKTDATTPDSDATPIDLNLYGGTWLCQVRPDPNNSIIVTTIAIDATNAGTGELQFAVLAANWADGLNKYTNVVFDIQVENVSGEVLTIWTGKFKIVADVSQ
jgi:hypothetical protein